jgi:hypothetical protein
MMKGAEGSTPLSVWTKLMAWKFRHEPESGEAGVRLIEDNIREFEEFGAWKFRAFRAVILGFLYFLLFWFVFQVVGEPNYPTRGGLNRLHNASNVMFFLPS